jgi:hypothetical protein
MPMLPARRQDGPYGDAIGTGSGSRALVSRNVASPRRGAMRFAYCALPATSDMMKAIIAEAKSSGLIRKVIEMEGLKGVRVAD